MLYLTSPSYIDFVPYVHFKTKHNLYLNEYALNVICMAHLGYHAIFFLINKYQLLYCILQYAHAETC